MTKPQKIEGGKERLKIEIPDGTPEEQIKMLNDWLFIIKVMGKVTGDKSTDVSPIKNEIKRLKSL